MGNQGAQGKPFNLNSLLLIIVLGVSSWALTEIISLGKSQAAAISAQHEINTTRDEQWREMKERLVVIERRLVNLESRKPL